MFAGGGTALDRNNTSFNIQLFEHLKKESWESEYDFLKYHQNLVRVYLKNADIDSRGVLAYHGMGLGKSILAVSIAMDMIGEYQPIILLTKSLQENMRGAIRKYVKMRKAAEPDYPLGRLDDIELDNWIAHNYSFVSMNASNMLKQLGKATEGHSVDEFDAALEKKFGEVLKLASLDGKLLIVDEAHNLFRAITNGSKNAIGLYDMVMKAKNLKIVFLTGTPIANDPFELVPCFNMLGSRFGKPILPESYKEFNKLFVDEKNGRIKNKEKFQNRLLGLVSHVTHLSKPGAAIGIEAGTKVEFPEEKPIVTVRVHMDADQYVMYQLARDKEKEEGSGQFSRQAEPASMTKPKGKASSTYRVHSRQLSNYCAPPAYRGTKDPKEIPADLIDSPKFRAEYEVISNHAGQLGLVYSQFTGLGGLGSFARFLESRGWEQIFVGKSVKTAGNDSNDGPELPSINSYIEDIDKELAKVNHHTWWVGGVDEDNIAETEDNNDSTEDEEDEMNIFESAGVIVGGDNLQRLSFKYATSDDVDRMRDINPAYVHNIADFRYPNYVLLIESGTKLLGYVCIEYSQSADKRAGRITSEFLDNIPHEHNPEIIKKIIADAIVCARDADSFKKLVTGGVELKPGKFAIISGEVPVEDRQKLQDMYNDNNNKHGGMIDLLLISSTGAEGLDLKNGRYVLITEPYWNWGRIMQINARLVRNDSHIALPEEEKNVTPYVFLAIPPESERNVDGKFAATTDTELYDESITNQLVIESFNEALREISIECLINDEKYCRRCSPTNAPLFTDDVARDVKAQDPCTQMRETSVRAEEIIIDDAKYYFTHDDLSIYNYRIFVFDESINGYRPLKESDPRFAIIIDAITAGK